MGNSNTTHKKEAARLKKIGIEAEHLVAMLEMIKNINPAKTLSHATALVVDEACKILSCDRATVFLVDSVTSSSLSSIPVTMMRLIYVCLGIPACLAMYIKPGKL